MGNLCKFSHKFGMFKKNGHLYCVKKLLIPQIIEPAHQLVFTPISTQLITATISGRIIIIDYKSSSVTKFIDKLCLSPINKGYTSLVRCSSQLIFLHVSLDNKWLAAANRFKTYLFSIDAKKNFKQIHVQKDKNLITAVHFNASSSNLLIANTLNQITIYDLIEGSTNQLRTDRLKNMPGTISGISCNPLRGSDNALVFTPAAFCYINIQAAKE